MSIFVAMENTNTFSNNMTALPRRLERSRIVNVDLHEHVLDVVI